MVVQILSDTNPRKTGFLEAQFSRLRLTLVSFELSYESTLPMFADLPLLSTEDGIP